MNTYNTNNTLLIPENIDNSIFQDYKEFNVNVVPTFLLFKKGDIKPFKKIEGNISELEKFLKK